MEEQGEDLEVLRTKTHMILAGLERDLAQFLKNLGEDPETTVNELLTDRIKRNEDEPDADPITMVYFRDLWEVAISAEKDPINKSRLVHLSKKATDKSVISARNATAHANKPFLKHYWYSTAALATSPELEYLGFKITKSQLQKAETNELSAEFKLDVVENYIKNIPNNLPYPDWKETGFFGRGKDRKALSDLILTGRNNSICVCGPGGIGKTALLLRAAQDITTSGKFDFLFFYSFKSEFLTTSGVETQEAAVSISQFKNEFDNFLTQNFGGNISNIKGALLLDNLEDLLVQNDTDFMNCIDQFPMEWKIISTSRLTPNGFKIISLDALENKTSITLGMSYAKLAGGNELVAAFEQNKWQQIKICAHNPLAIKLSIDLVRRGLSIGEASQQAISMVMDFSFRNLKHIFDEDTVYLLEYLRQGGKTDLYTICIDLNLETEKTLKLIENIKNTSLIRVLPDEGGENLFENTELTSNFLLSAEDMQKTRKTISEVLAKKSNQNSAVNTLNNRFFKSSDTPYRVPEDFPSKGLAVVEKLFSIRGFAKYLERSPVVSSEYTAGIPELLASWEALPGTLKKQPFHILVRARIFEYLFDSRADDEFKKYLRATPDKEKGYVVLASYYHRQQKFSEAASTNKEALKFFPNTRTFHIGYCVSLQYTNEINNVRTAIEHIRPLRHEHEHYAQTFVEAVKRAMESSLDSVLLQDCKDAIEIFIKYSVSWHQKKISDNFIDQIFHMLRTNEYEFSNIKLDDALIFEMVATHLKNGGVITKLFAAAPKPINLYLQEFFDNCGLGDKFQELNEQIVRSQELAFTESDYVKNEIEQGGLILVRVRTAVQGRNFCFATDKQGEDYFIHYSSVIQEFDGSTDTICIGSILAISAIVQENKEYKNAKTAYIVPSEWF